VRQQPIVLLQNEALTLRRLAEQRRITPGDMLRALIAAEAARECLGGQSDAPKAAARQGNAGTEEINHA
jgi:hypothetical protein